MSSITTSVPPPEKISTRNVGTAPKSLEVPGLTTLFTYSPVCRGLWKLPSPESTPYFIYSTTLRSDISSVYHEDYDYFWTSCQPLGYQTVYSPGVCPSGHTVASIIEYRFLWSGDSSSLTRWAGLCFPSGARVDVTEFPQFQFSTPKEVLAPYTTVIEGNTSSFFISTGGYYTTIDGGGSSWVSTVHSNLTTVFSANGIAALLYIMWESTDLAKFPPAYASSVAKQIRIPLTPTPSPGSSSTLPQQTSTRPSQPTIPSTSLSTGAKAGIGVGAALGSALLIGMGIILTILFLRRRRAKPTTTPQSTTADTPEMEDQDAALATRKWYVGGRWRSEAEVKNEPGELDSRSVRVVQGPPVELEAGHSPGRLD